MQQPLISADEHAVHSEALRLLNEAGIRYVVSGAAAIGFHTGIWRHTKDLDLFLERRELTAALAALAAHGYAVEIQAQHWLANARKNDYYVDLIYGFGGWRAEIDREWYARGQPGTALGHPVKFAPVEELIWIKAYVAHRERFDGADVVHLIQASHATLDWRHLLDRFDECSRLLLFYLSLYAFVYPGNDADIPAWVTRELAEQWKREPPPARVAPPRCRGPLIDRFSFLVDVEEGWDDGRVRWAEAQGWTARDIELDRAEAARVVASGGVQPDRAA